MVTGSLREVKMYGKYLRLQINKECNMIIIKLNKASKNFIPSNLDCHCKFHSQLVRLIYTFANRWISCTTIDILNDFL